MGNLNGWFDVTAFGADITGSADSTNAFNAAIGAAGQTFQGGGTIYVPAGTYLIAGSLSLLNNMNLVGDNIDSSLINFTTQSGYSLSATGASIENIQLYLSDHSGSGLLKLEGVCALRNVQLTGSSTAFADPTPVTITGDITWMDDIEFDAVSLKTGQTAMVSIGAAQAILRGMVFSSCNATKDANTALVYSNSSNFSISETQPGSSPYNYGVVVAVGGSDHYIITDNDFSGASTGGVSDGGTGTNKLVNFNPKQVFATPSVVLGSSAAAGSATTPIRSDSTIAAFDTTAVSAVTPDATATTGSVAFAARRDHQHGLATYSSSAAAVGTAAAGTSGTAPSRGDHVHPTGAGTPSTQAIGDSASTGSGPAAAMTDHKHAMPAFGTVTTLARADSSTSGSSSNVARADHNHGDPDRLALLNGSSAIIGSGYSTGSTGSMFYIQAGDSIVSTNASGDATLSLPSSFSNGVIAVSMLNGDLNTNNGLLTFSLNNGTPGNSGALNFRIVKSNGGGGFNGNVRVIWIAVGW